MLKPLRPRLARWFLPRFLKRRLPSSLFGRSLLIIVLPVAVMQIAVTWGFFDAHWQVVPSRIPDGRAGVVAWVVDSYQSDPSPTALVKLADRAERSLSLSVALLDGEALPKAHHGSLFGPLDPSP